MHHDYSRAIPETWQQIAKVFNALGDEHRQRLLLTFEPGERLTAGQLDAADVTVYHAGTAIKDGSLVTNGGRVLGVTATANTLPEALKKAYAATESIHFDKLHKRSDIGARALAAMQ